MSGKLDDIAYNLNFVQYREGEVKNAIINCVVMFSLAREML